MTGAGGRVRPSAPMRRSAIVGIVERIGFVSAAAITDALGVPQTTVRRDLDVPGDEAAPGGRMRAEERAVVGASAVQGGSTTRSSACRDLMRPGSATIRWRTPR